MESWRARAAGPAHLIALNAANEVAVAAFLEGRITFTRIAGVIEEVLERTPSSPIESIEDVLAANEAARKCTIETID